MAGKEDESKIRRLTEEEIKGRRSLISRARRLARALHGGKPTPIYSDEGKFTGYDINLNDALEDGRVESVFMSGGDLIFTSVDLKFKVQSIEEAARAEDSVNFIAENNNANAVVTIFSTGRVLIATSLRGNGSYTFNPGEHPVRTTYMNGIITIELNNAVSWEDTNGYSATYGNMLSVLVVESDGTAGLSRGPMEEPPDLVRKRAERIARMHRRAPNTPKG